MNWAQRNAVRRDALPERASSRRGSLASRPSFRFSCWMRGVQLQYPGGDHCSHLDDAQVIFRDKIKYPYDNLPDADQAAAPASTENATEMLLANNSSIRVGTSLRSGTLQYLHVSEYGKLARSGQKRRGKSEPARSTPSRPARSSLSKAPRKDRRAFLRMCETRADESSGRGETDAAGFQIPFLPMVESARLSRSTEGVVIPDELPGTSTSSGRPGIQLIARAEGLVRQKGGNPAYRHEAGISLHAGGGIRGQVEGAYYGSIMEALETQQRVGKFPAEPGVPVHTAFDLGVGDDTSVVCRQRLPSRIRIVGCYSNSGEGVAHYARALKHMYDARGWTRRGAYDWLPHDLRVREWGGGRTRIEEAIAVGLNRRISYRAWKTVLTACAFSCLPASSTRRRVPSSSRP